MKILFTISNLYKKQYLEICKKKSGLSGLFLMLPCLIYVSNLQEAFMWTWTSIYIDSDKGQLADMIAVPLWNKIVVFFGYVLHESLFWRLNKDYYYYKSTAAQWYLLILLSFHLTKLVALLKVKASSNFHVVHYNKLTCMKRFSEKGNKKFTF